MQQRPRCLDRQVSVQIHHLVTVPSLSHGQNVQEPSPTRPLNLPVQVFWFRGLPCSGWSLLPSYGHSPFVITCKSHEPCGFYSLGLVSSFSASLAFRPPCANQEFPSGVQDLDACLTSVLSISKSLVRAWIVAIRIRLL